MPPTSPMFHRKRTLIPLALALSLTACGDELDPERVPPESIWVTDRVGPQSTLRTTSFHWFPGGSLYQEAGAADSLLDVCAAYTPDGNFGVDGDSTACIRLKLDNGLLGTGRKTLKITGRSDYSAKEASSRFTPAPGHSPEIKEAYAWIFCAFANDPRDTTQEVSGRIVLEENSDTRLRGQVVATSIGKTLGGCFGNKTEANLSFDITR